jgi:hypothetical protein
MATQTGEVRAMSYFHYQTCVGGFFPWIGRAEIWEYGADQVHGMVERALPLSNSPGSSGLTSVVQAARFGTRVRSMLSGSKLSGSRCEASGGLPPGDHRKDQPTARW